MGEAILVKYGGASERNPLDDIVGSSDYCAILAHVMDSGGNGIPNIPINCNDGGRWYNYTTNENGYALFMTNSGGANIITFNWSILDRYNMIDQTAPPMMNIDAPVGVKKLANFQFTRISGTIQFTSNRSNLRFMDTKELKHVYMTGGGGGASTYCGGGGAAFNEAYNVAIDRSSKYSTIIGSYGRGEYISGGKWIQANAGGTTSGFGLSAVGGRGATDASPGVGGGSGSFKGGDGGANMSNGNPSAYANASFDYGGGGAGRSAYSRTRVTYGGLDVSYSSNANNTNHQALFNWSVQVQAHGVNGGGGNITIDDNSYYRQVLWINSSGEYILLNNEVKNSLVPVTELRFWPNGSTGSGGGALPVQIGMSYGRGGSGIIYIEI